MPRKDPPCPRSSENRSQTRSPSMPPLFTSTTPGPGRGSSHSGASSCAIHTWSMRCTTTGGASTQTRDPKVSSWPGEPLQALAAGPWYTHQVRNPERSRLTRSSTMSRETLIWRLPTNMIRQPPLRRVEARPCLPRKRPGARLVWQEAPTMHSIARGCFLPDRRKQEAPSHETLFPLMCCGRLRRTRPDRPERRLYGDRSNPTRRTHLPYHPDRPPTGADRPARPIPVRFVSGIPNLGLFNLFDSGPGRGVQLLRPQLPHPRCLARPGPNRRNHARVGFGRRCGDRTHRRDIWLQDQLGIQPLLRPGGSYSQSRHASDCGLATLALSGWPPGSHYRGQCPDGAYRRFLPL